MKRLLTFLIASAVVLMAYPAFATVANSPHDITGSNNATVYGLCEACHVPHAASTGKRIWNYAPAVLSSGGVEFVNWSTPHKIGALCGTCHLTAGAIYGFKNKADKGANPLNATAYANDAHSNTISILGTLDGSGAAASASTGGKPYMQSGSATMECTSCHDPHQDGGPGGLTGSNGIRPFLRAAGSENTISQFCADCHTSRYNSAASSYPAANSSTAPVPGAVSAGTLNHPVDIQYGKGWEATNGTADTLGGFYKTVIDANLTKAVWGKAGNGALLGWSLGGKFQTSAGAIPTSSLPSGEVPGTTTDQIGCMTCHAVHKSGTQVSDTYGAAANGTGSEQALWLLATPNGTNASINYNGLCETCHGNPITTGGRWGTRAGGYATVNSGQYTASDHPIDGTISATALNSFVTNWTMSGSPLTRTERTPTKLAKKTWPMGFTKTGVYNQIICTSCHSAHKAGTRLRRYAASGTEATDWCESCHPSVAPLGHHSNKYNDGAGTNPSTLDCSGCHSYGGSSDEYAHNYFGYYNLGGDNFSICEPCHTGGPGYANVDPTTPLSGGGGNAALPADHLGAVSNLAGSNPTTHYIGSFAGNNAAGKSINVKTTFWNNSSAQMLPDHLGNVRDYSKYGSATYPGTGGTQVDCESCHSILGNTGRTPGKASASSGYMRNLLLQDYVDNSYGNAVNGPNGVKNHHGSGLCVGCHNSLGQTGSTAANYNVGTNGGGKVPGSIVQDRNAVPANMHPMTNWSIDRAVDAGRPAHALVTDVTPDGSYANACDSTMQTQGWPGDSAAGTAAATGAPQVTYPKENAMDCDSCHRPHNAPANSWSDRTKTHGTNSVATILEIAGTPDNNGDLCTTCHAY